MAEMKTKPSDQSVEEFLNNIPDEKKRRDCFTLLNLMKQTTQIEPKMWGSTMVGFGDVHYKYESGREGDWFKVGFSPRKQNLTLYLNYGFEEYEDLLAKLGKHKLGKACLYINKVEDVDLDILKQLVEKSYKQLSEPNP